MSMGKSGRSYVVCELLLEESDRAFFCATGYTCLRLSRLDGYSKMSSTLISEMLGELRVSICKIAGRQSQNPYYYDENAGDILHPLLCVNPAF